MLYELYIRGLQLYFNFVSNIYKHRTIASRCFEINYIYSPISNCTLNKQWLRHLLLLGGCLAVVILNPIKGWCFCEHDTLHLLLSTGSFQERIQEGFYNQIKIN